MKKIDHVRKTVYIIVGILTIISLVFSLCKKVGLCASSSLEPVPFSPLPFYYGGGIGSDGSISDSLILQVVDDAITRNGSAGVNVVVTLHHDGYSTDTLNVGIFITNTAGNTYLNNPNTVWTDPNSLFPFPASTSSTYNGKYYSYFLDGSFYGMGTNLYYYPSKAYTLSPTNTYIYKTGVLTDGAVLYLRYPDLYVNQSGQQIFYEYVPGSDDVPPFSGHSKGGVLGNYIDSHDLIEDSSDVPHVDVSPPADPTTNNLLQKILNGLGVLNGSIQSGVLTIGDYIGQGFAALFNWFTEPFDSDQFNSDLNEISLINDFSNLKSQVENCGMFDWSDVTPAQSLSFTFDVGGAVLPHTSCVVDFSWYTGTVKNICVAVICTFLVLGLLVTIINQLPNIIGGKSGDKGGGSDS